jgi:predicted transcriptional regulator
MIINKKQAVDAINAMPKDEYEVDDILEEIIMLEKIQKGLQAVNEGKVLSEEDVEKEIAVALRSTENN